MITIMMMTIIMTTKQHPLILSTPMVLATLRGDKDITRRTPNCTNSLVDGKRISGKAWKALELDFTRYDVVNDSATGVTAFKIWAAQRKEFCTVMPIYRKGDTIWFKETWAPLMGYVGEDSKKSQIGWLYKADSETAADRWQASMFMPRSACRLFATIPSPVTCERLQDITEEQAKREGVDSIVFTEHGQLVRRYKNYSPGCLTYEPESAVESFKTLWASISGWDSYAANGPVYVIPFELIPEAEVLKEDVNTMGE